MGIFGLSKIPIMKTIAVLTDFSERSEHAAKYALHLAQKLKANILLVNAFLVPADIPMIASEVAWPSDYEEDKSEAEKELDKLCQKLVGQLEAHLLPGDYLPKITFECKEGPICNALAALEEHKDVFLTVIGTHASDRITSLVFGNSCRQIIDSTQLPLLLVPEHTRFTVPEKFAFATNLGYRDVAYLEAFTRFAACFSGDITVINVTKAHPGTEQCSDDMAIFTGQAKHKINYKKIAYCSVPARDPELGLEWLLQRSKPDMLVMMHHESGFLKILLNGSLTQKMAAHTPVPIMVLPYGGGEMFVV